MKISLLLRELAGHGVGLNSDGFSLPAPKWPSDCSKELRQSFSKNRRAIMARIAPPVFIYFATLQQHECSANPGQFRFNETAGFDLCLAEVDHEFIIWIPALTDDSAESLTREIGLQRLRLSTDATQIFTGRTIPSILRRAVRSARAFCTWDSRTVNIAAWRKMGLPEPVRWIDACDLGRAGGWPTDWEQLQWNLLRVRNSEIGSLPNRSRSDDMQTHTNRLDPWTEAIRPGLDQLLGTADVYDRLKRHDEPEVLEVHHEINSHGIGLDVELAHAVLSLAKEFAESHFSDIVSTTAGTMTVPQLLDDNYVLSWLRYWSLQFPDMNAATIIWYRDHMNSVGLQPPPPVDAVLQARLALARQPISSLMRALELVDDHGRVKNHMNYFANTAGEFSSCGIEFGALLSAAQNSPEHWRGLRTLESAGLVTVKRCRGSSPLVTIVEVKASKR